MKKKKDFDAVKFMREQRERISRDIQGMSFEEEKAYYKSHSQWLDQYPNEQPNNVFSKLLNILFPKNK